MQTFKDSETGQYWQFEDDVIADNTTGAYVFHSASGEPLELPETLEPADIEDMPAPEPANDLPQSVTRYQLREAMRLTPWPQEDHPDWTLFDAFTALMSDPATPAYYRSAWDELQAVEHGSSMFNAAADVLGMPQDPRDDLFRFAATLKA